jgi:hypothetical protein
MSTQPKIKNEFVVSLMPQCIYLCIPKMKEGKEKER